MLGYIGFLTVPLAFDQNQLLLGLNKKTKKNGILKVELAYEILSIIACLIMPFSVLLNPNLD